MAAVPLLLWAAANPVAGAATLVAVGGLAVGTRRTYAVVRCLQTCGAYTVEMGRSLRVTVVNPAVCDPVER